MKRILTKNLLVLGNEMPIQLQRHLGHQTKKIRKKKKTSHCLCCIQSSAPPTWEWQCWRLSPKQQNFPWWICLPEKQISWLAFSPLEALLPSPRGQLSPGYLDPSQSGQPVFAHGPNRCHWRSAPFSTILLYCLPPSTPKPALPVWSPINPSFYPRSSLALQFHCAIA